MTYITSITDKQGYTRNHTCTTSPLSNSVRFRFIECPGRYRNRFSIFHRITHLNLFFPADDNRRNNISSKRGRKKCCSGTFEFEIFPLQLLYRLIILIDRGLVQSNRSQKLFLRILGRIMYDFR